MSGFAAYPLAFAPVYKDYVWGGDRILQTFHRKAPPGIYAESWEISAREEGPSIVRNGALAGQSLAELMKNFGAALAGKRFEGRPFPLLFKLIDAHERLSVQVHPNDADAARDGGEAKSELWHVLYADPGSHIFAGLQPGVTRRGFEEALRQARVDALLYRIPVQEGDTVYIPGGRVHALDRGCMIYEVQQNSNTTYRFYDWGRVGQDGRPREMHLAQALRVTDWRDHAPAKTPPELLAATPDMKRWKLLETPFARLDRLELTAPLMMEHDGAGFQALFCLAGHARLVCESGITAWAHGTSILIPAALRQYRIEPIDRPCTVLLTTVP